MKNICPAGQFFIPHSSFKMLPRAPLHTERLCLRPYEPADADTFFALLHADRPRFRPSFPDRLQAVRSAADAHVALRPSPMTGAPAASTCSASGTGPRPSTWATSA